MNAQLDLILNKLADAGPVPYAGEAIASAFAEAGYGSPAPSLQRLMQEGYLGNSSGANAYELSPKGMDIRMQGGFSARASRSREKKVAVFMTVLVFVLLGILAALTF